MKIKKIAVIAGAIILILALAVILGRGETEKKEVEVKQIDEALPFEMRKVQTINWDLKDQEIEKKMKIYGIEKRIIREEEVEIKGIYVDQETGRVVFSEDVRNKSQLVVEKKMGEAEIRSKFFELMSKIRISNLESRIEEINYLSLIYPQWQESTKEGAEAVEIRASWYWQGYPIENFEGYPIVVVLAMDGRLLKLDIDLGIGEMREVEEVEIKGIKEIQSTEAEEFRVWKSKTDGNELEIEPEGINQIEAKGVKTGYMVEKTRLVPYFFIEGQGGTILILAAKKK